MADTTTRAASPASGTTPPPLPEYTCGNCGGTFGTNCTLDDIACTECRAHRCPRCAGWFGGDADVPEPVTPEGAVDAATAAARLAEAAERLAFTIWRRGEGPGKPEALRVVPLTELLALLEGKG